MSSNIFDDINLDLGLPDGWDADFDRFWEAGRLAEPSHPSPAAPTVSPITNSPDVLTPTSRSNMAQRASQKGTPDGPTPPSLLDIPPPGVPSPTPFNPNIHLDGAPTFAQKRMDLPLRGHARYGPPEINNHQVVDPWSATGPPEDWPSLGQSTGDLFPTLFTPPGSPPLPAPPPPPTTTTQPPVRWPVAPSPNSPPTTPEEGPPAKKRRSATKPTPKPAKPKPAKAAKPADGAHARGRRAKPPAGGFGWVLNTAEDEGKHQAKVQGRPMPMVRGLDLVGRKGAKGRERILEGRPVKDWTDAELRA